MTPAEAAAGLSSRLIREVPLVFASKRRDFEPRSGLIRGGPFGLHEAGRHPEALSVGIVGTGETIDGLLGWLKRCESAILSSSDSLLYPTFPSLSRVFHSRWAISEAWKRQIPTDEIGRLLRLPPGDRFPRMVELFAREIEFLAERDPHPQIVMVALPREVVDYCSSIGGRDASPLTPTERKLVRRERKASEAGQPSLLPLLDPDLFQSARNLIFRNFRRALKARAMKVKIATQLAQPRTWDDRIEMQPAALRAWNFCVAAYYKAGGIPWSVDGLEPNTCYVGIDFFRKATAVSDSMQASLAQVFDEHGEGHVLRGGEFAWNPSDEQKSPHLPESEARVLISSAIEQYRRYTQQAPTRVVLHKRSHYEREEVAGFQAAIREAGVTFRDFVSVTESRIRLFREGRYPPIRGTLAALDDRLHVLYTTGYVPSVQSYQGPYIPAPLEITRHLGDSGIDRLAKEVLALSRLDWNTSSYATALPVTLNFADRVGEVLTELPSSVAPESAYRYYM